MLIFIVYGGRGMNIFFIEKRQSDGWHSGIRCIPNQRTMNEKNRTVPDLIIFVRALPLRPVPNY